jgi:hypothetical protein
MERKGWSSGNSPRDSASSSASCSAKRCASKGRSARDRGGIGARRAPDPQVDAAGVQRLQRVERSATCSGTWFGSMIPPEPTRIRSVAAATCPIRISGAELAMLGMPWCSANQ